MGKMKSPMLKAIIVPERKATVLEPVVEGRVMQMPLFGYRFGFVALRSASAQRLDTIPSGYS